MDLIDYDLGRIGEHIQLIERGVRAAAQVTIRQECQNAATNLIASKGLRWIIEPEGEHHASIVFYEHEHLDAVIKQISVTPEPLRSWCLGKLFGYAETHIGAFLSAYPDAPGVSIKP